VRVITLNLNGIRSAAQKGVFAWLASQNADLILFQEVRAQAHQLPKLEGFEHYHAFWNAAERPGYSGVGALSKLEPKGVTLGMGSNEFDAEGRIIKLEFEQFQAISAYLPSGTSGEDRQNAKYRFLDQFLPYLQNCASGHDVLVAGDFNIAHQKIDLKNWRSNQTNSGFLPKERAWLDTLIETGFHDVFRSIVGQTEHYSWWSNRGNARANNVGWRIDYHFCTATLAARAANASIYREQFFSDHAPVIIDYSH
jgi:exodeoxyribonuclease III